MPVRREHTDSVRSETQSRAHRYDALQKKTAKDASQMDLGFDAPPPSRSDAQQIVQERKKSKQASAKPATKVVRPAPTKGPAVETSSAAVEPVKAQPVKPKAKGTQPSKGKATRKTQGSAKKAAGSKAQPKGKVQDKPHKKRTVLHVEISLPVFITLVIVVALLAGSAIAMQIIRVQNRSVGLPAIQEPEYRSITVEAGMSARQVSQLLEQARLIDDARAFERFLEVSGDARRLQQGTYMFKRGMSYASIAEEMVNIPQAVSKRSLVVYAGYTLRDIDSLLGNSGLAGDGEFLQAVQTVAFERGLPFTEGWFLSGTYEISQQKHVALSLAIAMQDALNEAVRPYLAELERLDITLAQAIIIASMIQRETNEVSQMPIISGVIHNRIKADMPLGIDATLRYGLGVWDRPLTETELQSDHPFNTRRTQGLPPSGIGAASMAALDAALMPQDHQWYYYIHDKQGNLHPAKTYGEHKENIARYL